MHIFCLDYTVSVSKSYPLRVQNKLTTSAATKKNPSTAMRSPSPSQGSWRRRHLRGSFFLQTRNFILQTISLVLRWDRNQPVYL